ncbi:MAG TPA: ester cyclase [Egibacteraceae bacterium]|nr:ester cyclase [Actinomycetota bacterium]HWB70862.1 ester cyclase [Egibacteraceae bacterium]
MSPDELKARARRIPEQVLTQGDFAAAEELIAPNYVHHVPGWQPDAGLAGVKQWVTLMRRTFPDFHVIVEDEFAEGDRVVQRISMRGTQAGEFLGVPPTGKQVTFQVVDINRAGPDGRFVEHWSSVDLFGLLQQLGALPPTHLGAALAP